MATRSLLLLWGACSLVLAISPCGDSPCLPGLNQLGVGYNVLTGESTNLPVLAFHYDQEMSWFDPFANMTYAYPDEAHVSNRPITTIDSFVYYKSTDYQSTLVSDSGIGLSVFHEYGAAFSLSRDVQDVELQMSHSKVAFSLLRDYFTLYRIKIDLAAPSLSTQSQFQYAVSLLPQSYDESSYGEFVSAYGTHVVTSGLYGGAVLAKTFLSKGYFLDYSSQVASYNAKLQFLGLKNGVGPTYNHPQSASYSFGLYGGKSMEFEFIGGMTTLSISQYADWVDTVRKSPAQVRNTLVQISEFVEDPVRQKNLELYLTNLAKNHRDSGEKGMQPQALKLKPCRCHWSSNKISCDRGYVHEVRLDNDNLAVEAPYCCDMCYEWSSSDVFSTPYGVDSPLETTNATKGNRVQTSEGGKGQGAEGKSTETEGQCGDAYPYAPENCGEKPCLPGLDTMGIGFDIVKGTPVSSQVIELTYEDGNTWRSPFDDEKEFAYPDQVGNGIVSNPASNVYSSLARSEQEVAFSSSSKNGITVPVPGYFSYSSHVQESADVFYGGQSILSLYSKTISLYSISLTESLNTTASFKRAVSRLPSEYDATQYGAFIDQYGTHAIITGVYGGEASMSCSVDMEYFSANSDTEVQQSTSILFASFTSGQSMTSNNKEFNLHSVAEFQLSGGNAATLKLSGSTFYNEWTDSLHCDPSQVERKLLDIQILVGDSQKRANLQRYISEYVASHAVSDKKVPRSMTIASYETNLDTKTSPNCLSGTKTLLWTHWYYNAFFDNYNYWSDPYSCTSVGWKTTAAAVDDGNQIDDVRVSPRAGTNVPGSLRMLTNRSLGDEADEATVLTFAGVSPTTNVAGQPYACKSSTVGAENVDRQSIHYLSCPPNSFLSGFEYRQHGQGHWYAVAPLYCQELCFNSYY